jgi:hypothetical protein
MTREYDKNGLPVLPEGYYWSVKPNSFSGSPYLHLMKEVNLFFFKWPHSVASEYMVRAYRGTEIGMRYAANAIMDRWEMYGDYR